MLVAAGVAGAWPIAARGQSASLRRIAVLMGFAQTDPQSDGRLAALRNGLHALGWTEGRNIEIETRWATTDVALIEQFAKELIALRPDLIVSGNTPTTKSLLQHTRTIPIVLATVSDPVGSGFVQSFAWPGGNVTGFTNIEPTMASKWVELSKEIAPKVSRLGLMFNPITAPYAEYYLNPFRASAAASDIEAHALPVRDAAALERALFEQSQLPNGGLIVPPDSFLVANAPKITALAARYHFPAVYPFRLFAELGGLLSYGNSLLDGFSRAATYADRILRGATPSELPVQAPVKFELVVNLMTAKALGLEVPLQLQQRADEVIE